MSGDPEFEITDLGNFGWRRYIQANLSGCWTYICHCNIIIGTRIDSPADSSCGVRCLGSIFPELSPDNIRTVFLLYHLEIAVKVLELG